MKWSSIWKISIIASLQCNLKKEVRDEVDILHADKHQSFLQIGFNTLGIKVSYKVIILKKVLTGSLCKYLLEHNYFIFLANSRTTQYNKHNINDQILITIFSCN